MRVLMLTTTFLLGSYCMAQKPRPTAPTTGQMDPEIAAIAARAEKPKKAEFQVEIQVEAADDTQKAIIDQGVAYYRSIHDEDVQKTYDMFSDVYKKEISFLDFVKKDRMTPNKLTISRAYFNGECGLLRGTAYGNTNTSFGNVRVPVRLHIFKENGEWRVWRNPLQAAGFSHPRAMSIKPPCSFRDAEKADLAEVNSKRRKEKEAHEAEKAKQPPVKKAEAKKVYIKEEGEKAEKKSDQKHSQ